MPDRLSVEVHDVGDQVVVVPRGEVDIETVEELRDAVQPFLGPAQMIVLDLSEVTFADSSLLHVLVQARGELTERGGSLLLRNPSEMARRLLTMAELDDIVHVEVDRQNVVQDEVDRQHDGRHSGGAVSG